ARCRAGAVWRLPPRREPTSSAARRAFWRRARSFGRHSLDPRRRTRPYGPFSFGAGKRKKRAEGHDDPAGPYPAYQRVPVAADDDAPFRRLVSRHHVAIAGKHGPDRNL